MDKIKLLYVENIISRQDEKVEQQLTFFMQLENLGYDKNIDVLWSGEDGVWHLLAASYHSLLGNDKEYWQAQIKLPLTKEESLPGNIQFSCRYQIFAEEFWDNNQGQNYQSEADSGVKLAQNRLVQNIHFSSYFDQGQSSVPVTIAVGQSFKGEKVTIHWTTDDWKTIQKTACQLDLDYWNNQYQSNARNPNQYQTEIWKGQIECSDSFKLQYSLCCEGNGCELWENNSANNYTFQREQLKVLILNLHCYQEENQDEKFTQIAKAINELAVDIVCFQEVAEYWRDGQGDWESNSAKLINDRLKQPFHLHTDWSHLGFDKYREGVAILSRFPLSDHEAKYVSDSEDIYNIHSRKVVKAKVHVPYIGAINVFSAHLSWLEDGFEGQFERLHDWAESRYTDDIKATLLCGDFNVTAGTTGYKKVVDLNHYDDQFLAANEQGVFDKVFRVNDAHWQDLLVDDYRIDYVFMNKESQLKVTSAKVIFTEQEYGRVSDHCGYFMTFEPRSDE